MKYTTNFISAQSPLICYIQIFLYSLAFGCFLLILYMQYASSMIEAGEELRHSRISQLSKRLVDIQVQSKDSPTIKEISHLNKRIDLVNKAYVNKGMSSVIVLATLERIMPKNAYVTEFSYDEVSGKVSITVESANSGDIEFLLQQLEKNRGINQPGMNKKSRIKRDEKQINQAELSYFQFKDSHD